MNPCVSVVMPVYNSERYLKDTLNTLINQNLKEVEIICIDDGSIDSSLKILNQYAELDSRIKSVSKEHSNAGEARNIGISRAIGEYIIFLDSDDIFLPEMLENAYDKAKETKADIVVFGGYNFSDKDGSKSQNKGLLVKELLPKEDVFNLRDYSGIISFSSSAPWNKLFRRKFIEENGLLFQSLLSANDLYFVTMAMLYADRITTIDKELIGYRTGNANSLQGSSKKSPYDGLQALTAVYDELKQKGIFEEHRKNFNERCAAISLYLLRQLGDEKVYEQFYKDLRGNFFLRVGMDKAKESDYFNRALFKDISEILNHNPLGYLLEKNRNTGATGNNWLFPFGKVDKGSSVILYGAGNVGKCFYKQIKKSSYCNLVGWLDRNEGTVYGETITVPDKSDYDADFIIIAVENGKVANEIRERLISFGVDNNKIIWEEAYRY